MKTHVKNIYYRDADRILVAVDCIIFGFEGGNLQILLFKRKVEPFRDRWTLIGDFVNEDESVYNAARRVLLTSTGLSSVYMKQLYCYGEPDRDIGGRVISVAYYALIRLDDQVRHSVKHHRAKWFAVDEAPSLILDHGEMVVKALDELKKNAKYKPIGFELLSEKFTMPQLQKLYEAMYQKSLDRRNFHKKILSMNILKKLNEKDRTGSKKGAYLYRFDEAKYKKLLSKGYVFGV